VISNRFAMPLVENTRTHITLVPQTEEMQMLYLVEFENSFGATCIRLYGGNFLWDAVADAEADITNELNSRITRVWPIDDLDELLSMQCHDALVPFRTL